MVEGFVVEEAGRVKGRRRGAKDVGIGVELAKGSQERFPGVHAFAANGGFDCHFPSDRGVVVEAEAFVPDGVELGAV